MRPARGMIVAVAVGVALAVTLPTFNNATLAQIGGGPAREGTVERLYILDGGVGHAGNANSWSNMMDPPGTPVDISAPCHLIQHARGYFMFDTCPNDVIATMPNGYGSSAGAIRWTKTKTIKSQLDEIKVAPTDVKYIGISHSHADHTGNVHMFPNSIVLIQRREYLNAFQGNSAPSGPPTFAGQIFPREHPVVLQDGDYDVFGDGSVRLFWVGGHTPGSQVALVRLPKTGYVMLSGDAVHTLDNWRHRRIPRLGGANDVNNWASAVPLAYQRIADLLALYKAELWIHHDIEQYKKMNYSPQYYE